MERPGPVRGRNWIRPTAGGRPGSAWAGSGRSSGRPPTLGPVRPGAPGAWRPAPYLRRAFTVARPVVSARLYVTALGLYEARLNGAAGRRRLPRAGLDRLRAADPVPDLRRDRAAAPGRERARRAARRRVVLRLRRLRRQAGRRALRRRPELLAQLVHRVRRRHRASGSSPTASGGPRFAAIRHADLLMGERHDLRARAARLGRARLRRRPAGAASAAGTGTAGRWSPTPGRPSG